MKANKISILLSILIAVGATDSLPGQIALLPLPQSVEWKEGTFALTNKDLSFDKRIISKILDQIADIHQHTEEGYSIEITPD
ncbi:MAG: hypothetical protein R6V75_07690 [Bacteroidales bacterium]